MRVRTAAAMVRPHRIAILLLVAACGAREVPPEGPPDSGSERGATAPAEIFSERAAASGLLFIHFNGMSGAYYMAEVTGAGAGLIDLDNDGDLDAYMVQGTMLGPGKSESDALFPPDGPGPRLDALFRNELGPGSGGPDAPRFTEVTAETGLLADGYGMGVAAGDYDNDGFVDLYLTNFGPNQLWRNLGGWRFEEATAASGTGEERWSVPAVFFDFDADGWLDLFVGNYIAEDFANRPVCRDFTGALDYCGPGSFPSEPDRLFRNRGDGTFADVTAAAGLRSGFGAALGVVAADFNGDGRLDLYVANDGGPNNLWINHGDGTFTDEALLAGCSVNAAGKAEASMGVDAADFDADGDLDLFMTHLTGETNTLYLNDGTGLFDDHTTATGIGSLSRPFTSFGTAWIDYDNDGLPDLLTVSGAVKKIEALARQGDPFPLHQPNQLFRNVGGRRFEEVTARAGAAFALSEVSRGAAFGDVDNDGDTDVLISNNSAPARLLINNVGNRRHWVGLRLIAGDPPRDMLGARAAVLRPDGTTLWDRAAAEGSFGSANDPRVLVGLGDDPEISAVRVVWPDGLAEEWTGIAADRYHELRRGTGRATAEGAG